MMVGSFVFFILHCFVCSFRLQSHFKDLTVFLFVSWNILMNYYIKKGQLLVTWSNWQVVSHILGFQFENCVFQRVKANQIRLLCIIAISPMIKPLWQHIYERTSLCLGTDTQINGVSHQKLTQFIIISLQKCLWCRKCLISVTNGNFANFEPPWQQIDN